MKRYLLILGLLAGLSAIVHAGDSFTAYASTDTTTVIYNGAARVDEFDIENSSITAQTVTFYDGTTAKWSVIVASSTGRDVHLSTYIKFRTSVCVGSSDLYGNNKVKVQIVVQ
jgi:hypothetical protein